MFTKSQKLFSPLLFEGEKSFLTNGKIYNPCIKTMIILLIEGYARFCSAIAAISVSPMIAPSAMIV